MIEVSSVSAANLACICICVCVAIFQTAADSSNFYTGILCLFYFLQKTLLLGVNMIRIGAIIGETWKSGNIHTPYAVATLSYVSRQILHIKLMGP